MVVDNFKYFSEPCRIRQQTHFKIHMFVYPMLTDGIKRQTNYVISASL